jgi:hypothetical protein
MAILIQLLLAMAVWGGLTNQQNLANTSPLQRQQNASAAPPIMIPQP